MHVPFVPSALAKSLRRRQVAGEADSSEPLLLQGHGGAFHLLKAVLHRLGK